MNPSNSNETNNNNKLSSKFSRQYTMADLKFGTLSARKRIHDFGFINSLTLKLLAIIFMTIDHIGFSLGTIYKNGAYYYSGIMDPDLYQLLRIIGRLAFPIFCYMITEGLIHTRSVLNYTIRLFIFALISQVPFSLVNKRTPFDFQNLNVYFTLALGLVAIASIKQLKEEKKNKHINTPIFFLLSAVVIICATTFAETIHCDYSSYGVVLIIIFYVFWDMPLFTFVAFALSTLLMSTHSQMYALFAIIPILLYNHKKGSLTKPYIKYFFYAYYPLHLIILYLISLAVM